MSITGNSNNIFVNDANLKIAGTNKGLLFSDGSIMYTAPLGSDNTNTFYFSNAINAFIITESSANVGFAGNTAPDHSLSIADDFYVDINGNLVTNGNVTATSMFDATVGNVGLSISNLQSSNASIWLSSANASNITTGTLANARLDQDLSVSSSITAAGVNLGTAISNLQTSNASIWLSSANASNLTTGTLANARLDQDLSVSSSITAAGVNLGTAISNLQTSNASIWLSSANASNLTTGTLANARLNQDLSVSSSITAAGVNLGTAISNLQYSNNLILSNIHLSGFNVGIGKDNPTYKLDVNGDARLLGYLLASSFTNQTEGTFSCNNGEFLSIECFNYGNTVKRPVCLNAYGGNVGINTASPSAKLHVVGNVYSSGNLHTAGNFLVTGGMSTIEPAQKSIQMGYYTGSPNDMGMELSSGSGGACFIDFSDVGDTSNVNFRNRIISTGGQLRFHGVGESAGYTPTMTLNELNVGIGTTSPEKVLDVTGDTQIRYNNGGTHGTVSLRLNHNAIGQGSGGGLLLQSQAGASGQFYPEAVINTWTSGVSGQAPLIFKIDDVEKMRLLTNGNFGIGTTLPAKRLEIQTTGSDHLRLQYSTGFFWDINRNIDGGKLYFASELGTKMVLTNDGNLGIGTTSPTYKLQVNGNCSVGSIKVAGGGTYEAGVVYTDANWGQLYRGIGTEGLAEFAWFNSAGTERMRMVNGNLGVGKSGPLARLEVAGGSYATDTSGTTPATYFRYDVTDGNLDHLADDFFGSVSIFADDDILSKQYIASFNGNMSASDERIKSNIQDISDTVALEQLRLLQPKVYNYKDTVKRGTEPVIGFIAQEVKEVIPLAVQKRKAEIPNIYEIVNVSQSNVITFTNFNTSNLNANSTVLNIRTVTNGDERVTLAIVIDEHTIQVVEDLSKFTGSVDENGNVITETITTTYTQEEYDALESKDGINVTYTPETTKEEYEALTDGEKEAYTTSYSKTETVNVGDQLFVFGQEVDDFNFLRKESIFTIATAALQEVDRQQQADKIRIATLESQLAALLSRVEALENTNP